MIAIETDVELKPFNSFQLSCQAKQVVRLNTEQELEQLKQFLLLHPQSCLVLGGGSNIVFAHRVTNLLIKMQTRGKTLVAETAEHYLIEAQAGENWHELVTWTIDNGWFGLENLALIPGTVGAAPVQNIGAYGAELKDFVDSIEVLDLTSLTEKTLTLQQCAFGYRESIFKNNVVKEADGVVRVKYLILRVRLKLAKAWRANLTYAGLALELAQQAITKPSAKQIFTTVCAVRRRKLPDIAKIGNVGSFFKNPLVSLEVFKQLKAKYADIIYFPSNQQQVKLSAGWLIEQCGLKGVIHKGAGVYAQQALVLVNVNQATSTELLELVALVQTKVAAKFNLKLIPEPLII